MKILFLLFLIMVSVKSSFSQAPNWLWAENGNGGAYEYGMGIALSPTGNIFIGARCSGTMTIGGKNVTGTGADNPFVGRFDNLGNAIWLQEHTYSGGYDYPLGLCSDDSDNTYSVGYSGNMYIDKRSRSGVFRWTVSASGNSYGNGIVADNAGNVYVTGNFSAGSLTLGSKTITYGGSQNAIFIAKLDSNGNCIWAKSVYGTGSGDGNDVGANIITDNQGNIYVFGVYTGQPVFDNITVPVSSGISNIFIAKYDTAGNVEWVTTASNASDVGFASMNGLAIDPCGNLFVAGYIQGTAQFGGLSVTSVGGKDIFLAKCLNNGNWEWVKSAGGNGDDVGAGVAVDKNADVYVGGLFASNANFGSGVSLNGGTFFVAKYANSTGDPQWAQSFSGSGGTFGGLAVDSNKFAYVVGSTGGTGTFGSISFTCSSVQNPYFAKLDTVPNRQIIVSPEAAYCPGSTGQLLFSTVGTFSGGNVFTAQLSDSSGSFITSTDLGTSSATAGTIAITIPLGTPAGSNYIIRVVSSSPAYSSFDYCFRVTIGGGSLTPKVSNDTSVCSGSKVILHASGGSTYLWSPGALMNDSTISSPVIAPLVNTTYTVTVSSGSCGSATATVAVTVNPAATVSVSPDSTTVCSGTSVNLQASGATSYTWMPATGLNCATCANPGASPTISTTYTVTGNGGTCSNAFIVKVNVGNTVVGGVVTAVRDTICQNTPGNLSITGNSAGSLQWQYSADSITYSNALSDTLANYKTGPLTQTTWYQVIVGKGNCSATSTTLKLYVPPALTASFNSTQTSATTLTFDSDSSVGSIRSYHWDFGDAQTSNEQNPQHTYAKDSTYYVCLTLYDGSNCSYTFCRYSLVTGIPTISAAGNWVIEPNPFSSQLTIRSSQLTVGSQIQSVEMYDVLGRVVINKDLGNTTNTSLQLDVSSLAKGMYFIMLRTANADYVQKVVKQ